MPAAVAVPLITAAISTGATVYGSRKSGQSARRAQDIQGRSDDSMLALETRRDEEARRQWDADQQQRAKEFAAAEEDRAFNRQQAEIAASDRAYQQQLLREREQRAVPYRAMSQQALGNLGQLLGIDMSGGGPLRTGGAAMSAPRVQPPTALMARSDTSGPLPQAPTLGDLIQQQRGLQ